MAAAACTTGFRQEALLPVANRSVRSTRPRLRTTNPIESTFATVRLRQRVTKGPGSRAAGMAMAFKLIESAQARWRAVNAPHLVALVCAGARFENGKLVERPDESGGDQRAT
jgi:putative transposase